MSSQLTLKQAIQFCYPDKTPNWHELSDDILIELICDYQNEQSCATFALSELSNRNTEKATHLAKWLITEKNADEWLKKSARLIIDF